MVTGNHVDLQGLFKLAGTKESAAAPPQRKPGRERSEELRQKGNELYRIGAYEAAVDYYTRAVNADPGNEKAFGNRCAAHTMMKSFREAVNDADYGIRLSPSWAKLHSRKAVAHFYLKEYDESVQAYRKAVDLDPGNEEYRSGLSQAQKLGGSVERMIQKKAMEREQRRRDEAAAKMAARVSLDRKGASKARASKESVEKERAERYEKEVIRYKLTRREAVTKWRASTGEAGWPEEDRGRSVRVDIFGNLRGKCQVDGSGCNMWHRDIDSVHNAWGNMEAIECSNCGHGIDKHENCGQYPLNEPLKPRHMGSRYEEELNIPGIHKA